ncbi:MAG: YihA family ribosome biogenesis GTP-binding protein [Bacteroidetes bacterium]|nr:MAG: YihA family ribosome biogenesis GTP-binding protein [Bacteroidota bacterium]
MEIQTANFVKSSKSMKDLPAPDLPEYAFVGRSNVGKSSLINCLCQRKSLAKTSGTPGKTQLINHFLINNSWYLVDLPGYGYAKVSKQKRKGFTSMISNYLCLRQNLMNVFVLVDSRLSPQRIDLEFMHFLGEEGIPFSIVLTKTDKAKKQAFAQNLLALQEALYQQWEELPPIFETSAVKKTGREELLTYIDQANALFKK